MQAIVEARHVTVEVRQGPTTAPSHPLTFVAHAGEIIGVWLSNRALAASLLRVIVGRARPSGGELRLRPGARVAVARTRCALEEALRLPVDLVVVDAADEDPGLDGWIRLASERERGVSTVVVTASVLEAYRCDRVALGMRSTSDLFAALERLVDDMHGATQELLGDECLPRRAAVLAAELQRANRAARDCMSHARLLVRDANERLRLSAIAARAAGATLDERLLERTIAEAERL